MRKYIIMLCLAITYHNVVFEVFFQKLPYEKPVGVINIVIVLKPNWKIMNWLKKSIVLSHEQKCYFLWTF